MNWWCLKGCCNSPLVMFNSASRSKALTVFCQNISHSDMERLSQSPQAPSDWPHAGADLMRAHYILSEPNRMQTFHKNSRTVHTHTHVHRNTHTLCQHERVTIRTTCGLRRPLSDQSLRRRRPVSNSTQEIFWFHVDTWVSDKKINHVPKKQEQNNVEWGYFFFCGQRVTRRKIVYL